MLPARDSDGRVPELATANGLNWLIISLPNSLRSKPVSMPLLPLAGDPVCCSVTAYDLWLLSILSSTALFGIMWPCISVRFGYILFLVSCRKTPLKFCVFSSIWKSLASISFTEAFMLLRFAESVPSSSD